MEIAMVFDGLDVGGIEKVGATYSKLLTKNGNKVTIVNLQPKKKNMISQFSNSCNFIDFFYSREFAPERYEQIVKKTNIGKYMYPFIFIMLVFFNFIYKLIFKLVTRQNKYDLVIAFSGHFNDLSFVGREYLKGKKKVCWLHGALYQYLLISSGYLELYRKIKNLVVLVDDNQREALMYNNCRLNINKIYNPINVSTHDFDENKVKYIKKKYGDFILMVARFSYPHKDQFTVIKAFEILVKKFHVEYNLLFIGNGPDLERVKRFTKQLNTEVQKRIFFIGEKQNVNDYYRSASILVHSSVVGEGLPTVILEALQNHLPVVSTDSKVGPREILGDNEYGLLCKIQDAKDMAQKIYSVSSNPTLREKLIKRGNKRINDFSLDNIYKKFLELSNEEVEKEKENES